MPQGAARCTKLEEIPLKWGKFLLLSTVQVWTARGTKLEEIPLKWGIPPIINCPSLGSKSLYHEMFQQSGHTTLLRLKNSSAGPHLENANRPSDKTHRPAAITQPNNHGYTSSKQNVIIPPAHPPKRGKRGGKGKRKKKERAFGRRKRNHVRNLPKGEGKSNPRCAAQQLLAPTLEGRLVLGFAALDPAAVVLEGVLGHVRLVRPEATNWSQHRIPSTNRHPTSMEIK